MTVRINYPSVLLDRPSVRGVRSEFMQVLARTFHNVLASDLAKQITSFSGQQLSGGKVGFDSAVDAIISRLNFTAWRKLIEPTEIALGFVSTESGSYALWGMGLTEDSEIGHDMQRDTGAWARTRAAEMVGTRYDGNKLVDNPSANMAITDSTGPMLRSTVAEAMISGIGPDRLADKLRGTNAFSFDRAKVIAETETAMAHNHGQILAYRASGLVTGVRWQTMRDGKVDADCAMNAQAGVIRVGGTFPSGHSVPPVHPRCRCEIVGVADSGGR